MNEGIRGTSYAQAGAAAPLASLRGVSKTYHAGDDEIRALRGIDLDIAAGEFLSIAGPSGSGKTTLLNLIGCIDVVDSGDLFIEGRDIARMRKSGLADFRRERLGFIFQSYHLVPVLTAVENVALPLELLGVPGREARDKARAMLAEVGLSGKEERFPSRMSGGQQQRVAVARALVKRPALVLADEPTANLDSTTGEAILDLMQAMNERHGTTFVFSTHDRMVMERARRLVSLHDGAIMADEVRIS
ncbi:MAG: ABC transporter ATP-binding protein [Spirochaetes bacterium]|nr:ABC transporter ATP-binding protein [Spirochaetota bacterium]